MNIPFSHQSVMPNEILSYFADMEGTVIVDATAGGGGHLALLAQAVGERGLVLAFDKDRAAHGDDAAGGVAKRFLNVRLFHRPFSTIKDTLRSQGIDKIHGLVGDLGVSSHQLDNKSRGFSFLSDSLIDMRMDQSMGMSAYEWLAMSSEETIAHALFNFGGERKSRAIARLIKKSWPIDNSTLALAKLVLSALRQKNWSKIHPATRTFQAIRMAVNGEVDELMALLKDLPQLLAVNGVAVFLSFHSVEDRIIKHTFKELAQKNTDDPSQPSFAILTKKPMTATKEEVEVNRRSRSAKLRAIKRVS